MTSCGCVCTTWYISTNASMASFQFTGRRHAYHFSARSDSTFHASRFVAAGSRHCRTGGASSSKLIHAHPPHISHRTGTRSRSSGSQVVLGERPPLRDRGVRAVEPVAPSVERAPEPAVSQFPLPSTTFTPRWRQAFWNATTPMSSVRTHDDRLVEELVLDEVVRLAGSPRAGTPSARPAARAARPPSRRSRGRSSAPSGRGRGTPSRTAPGVPTTSDPRSPCGAPLPWEYLVASLG